MRAERTDVRRVGLAGVLEQRAITDRPILPRLWVGQERDERCECVEVALVLANAGGGRVLAAARPAARPARGALAPHARDGLGVFIAVLADVGQEWVEDHLRLSANQPPNAAGMRFNKSPMTMPPMFIRG